MYSMIRQNWPPCDNILYVITAPVLIVISKPILGQFCKRTALVVNLVLWLPRKYRSSQFTFEYLAIPILQPVSFFTNMLYFTIFSIRSHEEPWKGASFGGLYCKFSTRTFRYLVPVLVHVQYMWFPLSMVTEIKHTLRGAKYITRFDTTPLWVEKFRKRGKCCADRPFALRKWLTRSKDMQSGSSALFFYNSAGIL